MDSINITIAMIACCVLGFAVGCFVRGIAEQKWGDICFKLGQKSGECGSCPQPVQRDSTIVE